MALIQVGSLGEFSVVPLETAMKKLPAAQRIDTFSVLSQVTSQLPPLAFDFAVSRNERGLTLKSLQLKKEFGNFISRLFNATSKIYFLAWAWDISGLSFYPGPAAAPSSCLIPLKGGEIREFIGSGALLFPPRKITAGLALRMQIWASRGKQRKFGKVMEEVASTIQGSELNTVLLGMAGGAGVATGGVAGALALVEPAALELAKLIGQILAKAEDEFVDYFEGYFPAKEPWTKGAARYSGKGSTLVLNRLT